MDLFLRSVLAANGAYENAKLRLSPDPMQAIESHLQKLTLTDFSAGVLYTSGKVAEVHEFVRILCSIILNSAFSGSFQSKAISTLSFLVQDRRLRATARSRFGLDFPEALCKRILETADEYALTKMICLLRNLFEECQLRTAGQNLLRLLGRLVQIVSEREDEFQRCCISALAAVARESSAAAQAIRHSVNSAAFLRALIRVLSRTERDLLVSALSLLAAVAFDDPLGQKLFSSENIAETFRLLLNVIVSHSDDDQLRNASRLLTDLLRNSEIADCFTSYNTLDESLREMLSVMSRTQNFAADAILELVSVLLKRTEALSRAVLPSVIPFAESIAILAAHSHGPIASAALRLLVLIAELNVSAITRNPNAVHALIVACDAAQSKLSDGDVDASERVANVLRVLTTLCVDSAVRSLLLTNGMDQWIRLAELSSASEQQEATTNALQLMCQLANGQPDMISRVVGILKDSPLTGELASGLWNTSSDIVRAALQSINFLLSHVSSGGTALYFIAETLARHNSLQEHSVKEQLASSNELQNRIRILEEDAVVSIGRIHNYERERVEVHLAQQTLQQQNSELERQLQESRSALCLAETAAQRERDKALAEVASIKDVLAARTTALQRADELMRQNRMRRQQVDEECGQLQQQVFAAHEAKEEAVRVIQTHLSAKEVEVSLLNEKVELLTQENINIAKYCESLKGENERLKPQLADQTEKLEDLYRKLILLTKANQLKDDDLELATQRNAQQQIANEKISSELGETQGMLATLRVQYDALKSDSDILQVRASELTINKTELEEKLVAVLQIEVQLRGELEQVREVLEKEQASVRFLQEQSRENEGRLQRQSNIASLIHSLTLAAQSGGGVSAATIAAVESATRLEEAQQRLQTLVHHCSPQRDAQ
eukprot:TRINITY_DN2738_c0_g1_i1.p1 TRINITY_DN2738_c0_g1~~TRINITY_DN2738_c0_g1_i1.p1  ORF type:complete len:899 (-),score=187.37 TRINITY_DN2738_c0_g1_i1:2127-4823(-)